MNTFADFYRKQKDRLFAYLMRMSGDWEVARDLMQESFVRYLDRYGQDNLEPPLLFTIGRNAFLDHVRKTSRSVPLGAEPEGDDRDPESDHRVREQYRRVLAALERLDEKDRDLLALVISSGLTYREIAEVVRISEANVKVRVHRARLRIRKILQEESL